eukprot:1115156-Pelagomonas_calceolata.AAC.4
MDRNMNIGWRSPVSPFSCKWSLQDTQWSSKIPAGCALTDSERERRRAGPSCACAGIHRQSG